MSLSFLPGQTKDRFAASSHSASPLATRLSALVARFALLSAIAMPLIGAFTGTAHADFSFVTITDTHVGAGNNAATEVPLYKEISALQPTPAFVVNTGDVCETATPEQYALAAKTTENLTLPLYIAPGNHDVRWNPLGKEGYTLGTKQPLYQSWDYQNVHFILLDSTVLLQHWGHFDKAMLDWLRADLEKAGKERPVIIGFHHWVGREPVMADNETELLDITRPYNVVLWLQGHGHSDIQWNVNGAPAVMIKGLYQGSYTLVEVTADRLRVLRRTLEKPTPTKEIVSISLVRPIEPTWMATAKLDGAQLDVAVAPDGLPAGTKITYRMDDGSYEEIPQGADGWTAQKPTAAMMVGEHRAIVCATLPDGRSYLRPLPFSLRRAGSPAPLWVTQLGSSVMSRLVRHGESLYVTAMGGDIFCLDPKTGAQKWKYTTGGSVFSSPCVTDDTVYFGSADHFIYAVDTKNGQLKWKTKTDGAVFGGAAVAKGVVCIASVDTIIYGLDERTGKVLWKGKGEGMYQSQAATDGTRFFVGGWDNYFRAFDVATGKELWKQKFGRAFYYAPAIGSPTTGDGRVFVTSNDGILHAMDTTTGKVLWEAPGPSLGYSGPLLHDGKIYNASLTDTGRVLRFDAEDGEKEWDTPTSSVIYDSSCAMGKTSKGEAVYVGCVNGIFSAVRASDGQILWQYHLAPGHVLASPTTDDKNVFISSQNGWVVALPLG